MKPFPNIIREVEKEKTLKEGLRVLLRGFRENCRTDKDAMAIDDMLSSLDLITAALEKNLK